MSESGGAVEYLTWITAFRGRVAQVGEQNRTPNHLHIRLALFKVATLQKQSDEPPRMIVAALGVPVGSIKLMEVDVEPGSLEDLITEEDLPDVMPADFLMRKVTAQEGLKTTLWC